MLITVNGEQIDLPEGACLPDLLAHLQLSQQHYAIAINQEVVPRSEVPSVSLHSGDRVELVQAVGGG